MKPLFAFITTAIILAALAIAFPDVLLDPGALMKGHQKLKRDCLSCHTPFRGVTSVQCISCHKQEAIGIKHVGGTFLPKDSTKVLFHKGLSASSCVECHTDHKGADASKAIKTFKHASLTKALQQNCIACHKDQIPKDPLHRYAKGSCSECHNTKKWKSATFDHKQLADSIKKECITCHKADQPNDQLHRDVTASCAACHGTTKWKPATFNHNQLAASGGKQCINCHKSDRPNDNMHRQSEANCAACHGTTRWKPATFNHDRYFRLDRDHQASCKTCHTNPANYKQYTCYNCHEHTPSNIAAKHREEGIYNYQNCIRCHRNGSREGGREGDD
jgi:hypothetical protein